MTHRHRHHHISAALANVAADALRLPDVPAYQTRLLTLFVEIEREVTALYDENRELRRQLQLTEDEPIAVEPASPPQASSDASSAAPAAAAQPPDAVVLKAEDNIGTGRVRVSGRQRVNKTLYRSEWQKHREYVGHRDGVFEIMACTTPTNAISRTGALGTGSADRTARLWSIHSSQFLYNYTGHKGAVNSVRFHPVEPLVCTGSGDRTCHVWKIPQVTLKVLDQLKDMRVAERPMSSDLADGTDSMDSRVHTGMWSADITSLTGKVPLCKLTGHTDVVSGADWLSDGKRLVTAGYDNSVMLWDIGESSATRIQTWNNHEQRILYTSAHATEPLAMTSSRDRTFRLWDHRKPGAHIRAVQGHRSAVTSAVFVRPGTLVVSSSDRAIKVWDLKYLKAPITSVRLACSVHRLSVSPVMSYIAAPLDTGDVMILDINGGVVAKVSRALNGHSKTVMSTAWGSDESRLFSAGWPEDVISWAPTKTAAF